MNLTDTILDPLLRADPMGPRITYYDDATGERIELSTVTLANWAAKTANLLRDELGAGPGTRVAVLLPAHWQTAAVLLGVWWIGAEGGAGPATSGAADVALCTSDRLGEADEAVAGGEVAVLSLDPFGKPARGSPDRSHRLRHRGSGTWRPGGGRAASGTGAGRPYRRRGVLGRARFRPPLKGFRQPTG